MDMMATSFFEMGPLIKPGSGAKPTEAEGDFQATPASSQQANSKSGKSTDKYMLANTFSCSSHKHTNPSRGQGVQFPQQLGTVDTRSVDSRECQGDYFRFRYPPIPIKGTTKSVSQQRKVCINRHRDSVHVRKKSSQTRKSLSGRNYKPTFLSRKERRGGNVQ